MRPTEAGSPVDEARGWGYLDGSPATDSMTAAILLSIAVCRDALRAAGRLDRSMDGRTETSIRDARAWLDLHFTVRENPGSTPARPPGKVGDLLDTAGAKSDLSGYHYDYLAALESSQSFLRFDDVGTHDWFAETAEYLTTHQSPDGRWGLTPFDTCVAVLALSRTPRRIDERSWK